MLDLYPLLEKIKQRASLYLGKKSLSHLHVFFRMAIPLRVVNLVFLSQNKKNSLRSFKSG